MKIQNSSYLQQSTQVARSSTGLQKIFEKLSSGKSLNRASDGAASIAMAKELEKQVRGFKQSDSNIGDALNALKVADGAGSGLSDIMQRQRDLALQAKNGTLNDQDRSALNAEYQQLSKEAERLSKSTQFNGQNLVDGQSNLAKGGSQIQVGPGARDQMEISKMDFSKASQVGDISTLSGASGALQSLDSQMKGVLQTRAQIGAQTNALEFSSKNAENQAINTTKGLSSLEDLDFAQALMDKSRLDVLNQAAIKSQASFNEMSKNNLTALL